MTDRLPLMSWVTGGLIGLAALGLSAVPALAGEGIGENFDLDLQNPATVVAHEISFMHDWILMPVITAIMLFVLLLLVYVMIKFNAKANPVASHVHHNTTIEILWTVVPIIILLGIAIPSFKLLFHQYDYPKPDVTIKATGNQWYWSYEYANEGVTFDSFMLDDAGRAEMKKTGLDAPRLLAVDNEVIVPVNKVVHVLATGRDVIHSWSMPAFGSKTDAVPGRITATWFKAERKGVFYGQCSELCGKDHAFMPIVVRVVGDETYKAWADAMKAGGKDNIKKAHDLVIKAALADKPMPVASNAAASPAATTN